MARILYVDGELRPESEAHLSPLDVGVIYGLGSFETVRVYEGYAFRADDHERRLRTALEALGLTLPGLPMGDVLEHVAKANRIGDGRGRVIATGGLEHPDGTLCTPRVFAEVTPWPRRPAGDYARGIRVEILSGVLGGMMPLAGMKSLSYLPNYVARRQAAAKGAEEAVLLHASGELTEGTTSNFFLVIGDRLVTPPADGRVLSGVTRQLVMEDAARLGIPVEERAVTRADVAHATGAFLTSTMREVLPIRDFGGVPLPVPGEAAVALGRAYRDRVDAFLARRRG